MVILRGECESWSHGKSENDILEPQVGDEGIHNMWTDRPEWYPTMSHVEKRPDAGRTIPVTRRPTYLDLSVKE